MELNLAEQVSDELVGNCEVEVVRQVDAHVVFNDKFDLLEEFLRVEMLETFMTLKHVLLQKLVKACPQPQ